MFHKINEIYQEVTNMKRNRVKYGFSLSIVILLGLLLISTAMAKESKTIKVRVGTILPRDDHGSYPALKFMELVTQRTKGQVQFEYFTDSVLGGTRDMYENLLTGGLEMVNGHSGPFAAWSKKWSFSDIPYVFRDMEHVYKSLLQGPVGKKLMEGPEIKKAGFRVITWLDSGFRVMLTKNKPINSIDDMKGVKFRSPQIKTYMETIRSLGALPTPIAKAEVYNALKSGIVDGFELPASAALKNKDYEAVNFLAVTNHIYAAGLLMTSEKFFQGLPSDVQRIMMEAGREALEYQKNLPPAEEAAIKELEKLGLKVTRPDLEPFREKVRAFQESYAKEIGAYDLLEEARGIK